MTKRFNNRIALVTGASRGIGAETAVLLAREGAHVIMLARTQGALEEIDDRIHAEGGTATLLPFDLGETKKIENIAHAITERFRRLDILVGNAAMLGALSPVGLSDGKLFEETFRVNFLANYHLIRTLDSLLRGSDRGRALFVTSGAAHMATPFFGAYAASKAALERMADTYAAETAHSPLRVTVFDPGIAATKMRAEAFPAENAATLPSASMVAERLLDALDTGNLKAKAAA